MPRSDTAYRADLLVGGASARGCELVTAQANARAEAERPVARVSGGRLLAAIAVWIVGSAIIGGLTIFVARVVAPSWAANTNEVATVVVAEVYAVLITTLVLLFGGERAAPALRLRAVPARDYVVAFALVIALIVLSTLAYEAAGADAALRAAYARLGTDGGRLGTMGPLVTGLSVLRAGGLAPFGEELLFRGAIFGWFESRAGRWAGIVGSGLLFGLISSVVGGTLMLAPLNFGHGLLLGWIRARSDSTLPTLAVHAAHNTGLIAIFVFGVVR